MFKNKKIQLEHCKEEVLTAKPSIGPRWDLKCLANSMPTDFFFQNFICPGERRGKLYKTLIVDKAKTKQTTS